MTQLVLAYLVNMRQFAVLLVLGLATGVIGFTFDRDFKINVYDIYPKSPAGVPPSYFIENIKNFGEFKFTDKAFHTFPYDFTDFVVAFKTNENFLQGYYVRNGNFPTFVGDKFEQVKPFYDYLSSGEYYAFTPFAARKYAPEYFNTPFKFFHYEYLTDVDFTKPVPVFFIIPKAYFTEKTFEGARVIGEYEVHRDGVQAFRYFGTDYATPITVYSSEAAVEFPISAKTTPFYYFNPQVFRSNIYRYELPSFVANPYQYFFGREYPNYGSFGKTFEPYYYPYYPYFPQYEQIKSFFASTYPQKTSAETVSATKTTTTTTN